MECTRRFDVRTDGRTDTRIILPFFKRLYRKGRNSVTFFCKKPIFPKCNLHIILNQYTKKQLKRINIWENANVEKGHKSVNYLCKAQAQHYGKYQNPKSNGSSDI